MGYKFHYITSHCNGFIQHYLSITLPMFQHGTTKASDFFNLGDFFENYILPELQIKNGKNNIAILNSLDVTHTNSSI